MGGVITFLELSVIYCIVSNTIYVHMYVYSSSSSKMNIVFNSNDKNQFHLNDHIAECEKIVNNIVRTL